MSKIRRSEKTLEELERISKEINPYTALVEAIVAKEDYFKFEKKVPILFDENTGKMKQFRWEGDSSYSELRVRVESEAGKYVPPKNDGESIVLNQKVLDKLFLKYGLDKSPLILDTYRGIYVVWYKEETYKASAHNDVFPVTEREICFEKINNLLTIEGLVPFGINKKQ